MERIIPKCFTRESDKDIPSERAKEIMLRKKRKR
jgi:hypothetical protein